MEIIGHGFLARHLTGIAAAHPGVVILAAGVSAASGTPAAEFDREAALLERVIARCVASGERLVFFSTASTGMYGAMGRGAEDEAVDPCTPYGHHKWRLEQAVRDCGAEHLIVRLAHVAGPGQPPHQLLPALLSQVLGGEVRLRDGARRDIIDIVDAVAILDRLLSAGISGDVVNIATGWAIPVERIVDRIEASLPPGRRAARRTLIATPPLNHLVSTDKLRRLVPETADMGFGEHYYEAVIDRYIPLSAESLV
jgi:nucleoside-diphosphate-sugar epimerase